MTELYVMKCEGHMGGVIGFDPADVGGLLKRFDPEARHGYGEAEWTHDVAEAMTFPDAAAVLAFWKTIPKSRPLRADGRPNRPLTAYTVSVSKLGIAVP